MESNEINTALELFRRRLRREPTEPEVARIEEGIRRGRDIRRVIAGFMAMDYHRAHRGPDAMSLIRSRRRPGRHGGRRHADTAELREKVHAAVDALMDYLEATREVGGRSRDGSRRGEGRRGRRDVMD